jgi:membrane fusion protein, heavy metal efflux system
MKHAAAGAAMVLAAACVGCRDAGTLQPAAGESQAQAGSAKPAAIVRTATVMLKEFPIDEIVAPGKIELNPNRISRVLMPVPGRVRQVLVKLGDRVGEGQPVATIESAEAGLALAGYAQAQAQVRQVASVLSRAEKDLARAQELNANKAAPLKDVINAQADVEQARANLAQMEVAAEEAKHRLDLLGLDPAHHSHEITARSPLAGKVMDVSVAPGELRNDTNQPLMTIADLTTVWVTSDVPEALIRLVNVNEPVTIELVAYPGETRRGRVRRIADAVDPTTRTVKVQAELDNKGGRLRPEMFARIRHSHGTRRLAAIPSSAVVHRAGVAWAFVERAPGRYEQTRIQIGEGQNGDVPILEGLKEGDRVVVEGAALLRGR